MVNLWKLIVLGGLIEALTTAPTLAQIGQTLMPMMGWPMTWPMVAGCAVVLIVLLLAAAALIKYLVFR